MGSAVVRFVVDTGSAVSLLPLSFSSGHNIDPTVVTLSSANGTPITVHGEVRLGLKFRQLRRIFTWTFVVAEVTEPLLGNDFLSHNSLIVDCGARCLCDSTTKIRAPAELGDVSSPCFVVNDTSRLTEPVRQLLGEFPELTSPCQAHSNSGAKSVVHNIDTGSASSVFAGRRRYSPEKQSFIKAEIDSLLAAGIVRASDSCWSAPVHLVPKAGGQWRLTGDYRVLNSITKRDNYPIPHLHDCSSQLHGKTVFSKVDLLRAYHQVPVAPADVPKTAVLTPAGLFEYLYMPFGLRNAPSTFQRYMDTIFREMNCVFVYIDDILVFSKNPEEHERHLRQVFQILKENALRVKLEKCVFFAGELDFLGYRVSSRGLLPSPAKVSALVDQQVPSSSEELRRFLGATGFYRRAIPQYADIVHPLTERIRLEPNSKRMELNATERTAVADCKVALSSAVQLSHPLPSCTTYQLVTDSSQVAVGAALHQMIDGQPFLLEMFSQKLSSTQRRYSTFDRELLGAYLAVLHFRHLVEGQHLTLCTDHRPLVGAFYIHRPAKLDRQQRHLSVLVEYVSEMKYIRGADNIVADHLSRPPAAETEISYTNELSVNTVHIDSFDLISMASAQEGDSEVESYRERLTAFPLQDNHQIWCDTSTCHPRPFVPSTLRDATFHHFHHLSHPGTKATIRLVKSRYFWPDMDRDIRNWVKTCTECQQSKVHRHTRSALQEFGLPSNRFEVVHIDIVGPLPPVAAHGQLYPSTSRYLLTMIDRASRWLEAAPMPDMSAVSVASAFLETWVSRFGVPLYLITDRGGQFESDLFRELSAMIGFHRIRTSAYKPSSNGMVERAHRTLKAAIRTRKENWLRCLPVVLLGIRATPNESGYSPFTAITGSALLFPRIMLHGDRPSCDHAFVQNLCSQMQQVDFHSLSAGTNHAESRPYLPKDLDTCDHVWVRVDRIRRPLEAPYTGPFRVVSRSTKTFTVETPSGDKDTVSIDRVKPAYLPVRPPVTPQDPVSPPTAEVLSSPPTEEEITESVPEPPREEPTRTTRSGRRVRFRPNNDYLYI